MRILVVGSGGREHALAWKLSLSPQVDHLFVAPGNGGTAAIAHNVAIAAEDVAALVAFARQERIDLTVVGPEAPLVGGLVDALAEAGQRAFGPSAAAAQLEGSKAFAKRFMVEEGIPTAVGAIFDAQEAARAYLVRQQTPIVVKASGLAAGKGVFVCANLDEAQAALQQIMTDRAFGPAGDEVIIEDCLVGEEASLLAFSDGRTVVPMLPARDYKRVGDGDRGPNTGGMGGYAPSPYLSPAAVREVTARVLQPAYQDRPGPHAELERHGAVQPFHDRHVQPRRAGIQGRLDPADAAAEDYKLPHPAQTPADRQALSHSPQRNHVVRELLEERQQRRGGPRRDDQGVESLLPTRGRDAFGGDVEAGDLRIQTQVDAALAIPPLGPLVDALQLRPPEGQGHHPRAKVRQHRLTRKQHHLRPAIARLRRRLHARVPRPDNPNPHAQCPP